MLFAISLKFRFDASIPYTRSVLLPTEVLCRIPMYLYYKYLLRRDFSLTKWQFTISFDVCIKCTSLGYLSSLCFKVVINKNSSCHFWSDQIIYSYQILSDQFLNSYQYVLVNFIGAQNQQENHWKTTWGCLQTITNLTWVLYIYIQV